MIYLENKFQNIQQPSDYREEYWVDFSHIVSTVSVYLVHMLLFQLNTLIGDSAHTTTHVDYIGNGMRKKVIKNHAIPVFV